MKYQKCSNDHEHRRVEVKDSGFYPLEMGRVLLSAARGVLKKSLPRGEPQTVSSMRGCENLRLAQAILAQVFGSDFAVPSWPALSPFSARGLEESSNSILVVAVGQAAGKGWVGGR